MRLLAQGRKIRKSDMMRGSLRRVAPISESATDELAAPATSPSQRFKFIHSSFSSFYVTVIIENPLRDDAVYWYLIH
jgi:hypothetical protein